MAVKKRESLEDYVDRLFDLWFDRLPVGTYRITASWTDREKRETNGRLGEVAMDVSSDYRYQQASIQIYAPTVRTMTDERIEEAVVHELLHVALCPMAHGEREDEEEVVVTLMARSFCKAYAPTKRK